MTGRPQVVMFHVSVGTANDLCAVINAAGERVPLIVTVGLTPVLEDGALGVRDTPTHRRGCTTRAECFASLSSGTTS
jgi:acetolactate synthase-1/2/3 large subunit